MEHTPRFKTDLTKNKNKQLAAPKIDAKTQKEIEEKLKKELDDVIREIKKKQEFIDKTDELIKSAQSEQIKTNNPENSLDSTENVDPANLIVEPIIYSSNKIPVLVDFIFKDEQGGNSKVKVPIKYSILVYKHADIYIGVYGLKEAGENPQNVKEPTIDCFTFKNDEYKRLLDFISLPRRLWGKHEIHALRFENRPHQFLEMQNLILSFIKEEGLDNLVA